MQTLTRMTILLALCATCAAMCQVAGQVTPAQTRPERKIAGATVTGRVTLQGKGKGGIVVGIRTGVYGPQMGPSYKGTTDSDGNYRITDVPPGSYHVGPMAPAYVVPDSTSFGGPGKALVLAEGEKVDNIDFSIIRGAVITGKITQSDGKPVIDERVFLMNADQINNRGARNVGGGAATDDRGVYRIYGLAAGKYVVAIGADDEGYNPSRSRPVFSRVFYPGVSNISEAKVVELEEGGEASNIDLTVGHKLDSFAASGTVVDGETNQPVANVRFGLQRIVGTNTAPFFGSTTVSNARGEFRLENITPGKYSIYVMADMNSDIRTDPVRFEIVDQNVTGLLVKTSKGAAISGVVVVDGTQDQAVYAKLAKMRLFSYVRPEGNDAVGFGRVSTIDANGGFRIGGLQGGFATFQLGAADPRTNSGFVISRVERDGVVQPRPGVEVKAGEQVAGVRIVVTYGTGSIRGTVKWDGGPAPAGVRMMVRVTKGGENFSMVRPQEVDARGHFVIEGLPGGTYELTLNAFAIGVSARMPSLKQSVTVTDGAVTNVELLIDNKSGAQPNP